MSPQPSQTPEETPEQAKQGQEVQESEDTQVETPVVGSDEPEEKVPQPQPEQE